MDKSKPYLTQYLNMSYEWLCKGIDIDSADENEVVRLIELKGKAIEQSGLTANELTLIRICRERKIFKRVNVYAHRCK